MRLKLFLAVLALAAFAIGMLLPLPGRTPPTPTSQFATQSVGES